MSIKNIIISVVAILLVSFLLFLFIEDHINGKAKSKCESDVCVSFCNIQNFTLEDEISFISARNETKDLAKEYDILIESSCDKESKEAWKFEEVKITFRGWNIFSEIIDVVAKKGKVIF